MADQLARVVHQTRKNKNSIFGLPNRFLNRKLNIQYGDIDGKEDKPRCNCCRTVELNSQ